MAAVDLAKRIPADAVWWLRPVGVSAYTGGTLAVVFRVVLVSSLLLVGAMVYLLVGIFSMASCRVAAGSQFEK